MMEKVFEKLQNKDGFQLHFNKKKKLKTKKIVGITVLIFVLSVILVNVIRPAIHKGVSDEYKKYIANTQFEADSPGTERVLCIDDNEEALVYRLRMIAEAKESVVLTTFDLRADEGGTAVMAALYMAAERGVKVRLLIDGIYQLMFLKNCDAFDALCMHENVDARFYNKVNLRNSYRLNYRLHDKYILVDDRMYLLGGRNTTRTFLGEPKGGANIDRDILVYNQTSGTGESFAELERYFNQTWSERCVKKISPHLKKSVRETEYQKFREIYGNLLVRYEDIDTYNAWMEDTVSADKITLLSNGTHAKNKEPRVLYAIEQLAKRGRQVVIQTPYIICNKYMYSVLNNIAENADVDIFINAVARGSNPWGCTDYLNNKEKILDTGVSVYEVMNTYAVHTKAVLIDDSISIIGSYNFDMRSTYLDTELMLVVDSKELNAQIRTLMDEYREKSIEVRSDGTETKGSLYEDRELTEKKQRLYKVLRVIIRPFRHML